MIPTKIPDYSIFDQHPYLLQQFVGTDIQKFCSIFNTCFNLFETAAFSFIQGFSLATATGNMLDIWGIKLGLPRYGRSDDSYRTLLQVQAFINGGTNTAEELIAAMRVLFNVTKAYYTQNAGDPSVTITESGAIGIYVYKYLVDSSGNNVVDSNNNMILSQTPDSSSQTILNEVVPAGVGLVIKNA